MQPDSNAVHKDGRPKDTEPLTLTLCPRCEADFRNSGHFLIKKGWQENKETCDFCNVGLGFTFDIYESEGKK